MTTDLDDRIREVVHTLARSAPDPLPFNTVIGRRDTPVPSPRAPGRRNLVAAVLASAIVAVGVGGVVLVRGSDTKDPGTSSDGIVVTHDVIEYRATPNASCDTAQPRQPGQFRESHIDVWVDRAGHRARMQATYPDGSTRDLITFGDGPAPDRAYTRGSAPTDLVGCGFNSGTFLDPGSGPAIPAVKFPALPSSHFTLVAGEHHDSRGRTAQLWTGSAPGSIEGPGYRVEETDETQMFVEPRTHRLLEQVVTTRWQTGATVTYRVTYISHDQTTVSADTFSTNGFRDMTSEHSTATTSLPTSSP